MQEPREQRVLVHEVAPGLEQEEAPEFEWEEVLVQKEARRLLP